MACNINMTKNSSWDLDWMTPECYYDTNEGYIEENSLCSWYFENSDWY